MFNAVHVIAELERNRTVFQGLLHGLEPELYNWKPDDKSWSILQIVCHLYDIEREDFRERVQSVIEDPQKPFRSIEPQDWIEGRKYAEQDYNTKVKSFLDERDQSIVWLHSLDNPKWDNTYQHQIRGAMSAALFISNWLGHDQLHIRQINRLKRQYLQAQTGLDLSYAGNW